MMQTEPRREQLGSKQSLPSTPETIERFLASGFFLGMGATNAKRLVDAFGDRVFDVLDNNPSAIGQVPGITARQAERIVSNESLQKPERNALWFFYRHGVNLARATRIYDEFKDRSIEVVSRDPYCLMESIGGFGFKTTDEIALALGVSPLSPKRLSAGATHLLREARSSGQCGLPLDDLSRRTQELLDVPFAVVRRALACETEAFVVKLVKGATCVFPAELHRAERAIAHSLLRLSAESPHWELINVADALGAFEKMSGLSLADGQRRAIEMAVTSKAAVITGGPGTGKTTIIKGVLALLKDASPTVHLCAPTGRAAKRLTESTGEDATTIHRLLGQIATCSETQGSKFSTDHVIVDEASMVDVPLMAALCKAIPVSAAILIVGDVNQLPSVGPGQVLTDIIAGLSHLSEDRSRELIGPSRAFSFSPDRDVLSGRLQDVEGELAQDGKVFSAMIFSVAGAILVERHVQDPMQAVLDGPMGADGVGERFRRQGGRRDVIAPAYDRLTMARHVRFDHCNTAKAGQAGLARITAIGENPVDVVAYEVAADLDAAMIGVRCHKGLPHVDSREKAATA